MLYLNTEYQKLFDSPQKIAVLHKASYRSFVNLNGHLHTIILSTGAEVAREVRRHCESRGRQINAMFIEAVKKANAASARTAETWRTLLQSQRRTPSASRSRGLLFYRVLELAVADDPVRYRDLTRKIGPKAMPPKPPRKRGHPPSLERPRQNRA